MDAENDSKKISLIFVKSDELRDHYFGLLFDNKYGSLFSISSAKFEIQHPFSVENNETTNIKLMAKPSSLEPFMEFANTNFTFEDDKIYNLQIITGETGQRVFKITEHKLPNIGEKVVS
jgi:hypothetical protein